jgi:Brp/Blh family beta-carotene 15,15'-monooxygenase
MTAQHWVGFVSIGVLFSLSIVDVFYFPVSRPLASVPMLIGLVSIGMGHGAFDSELIFSGKGRSESIWLFVRYTTVMVQAALVLGFFPVVAIISFLLLALIHFGKEDSESFLSPVTRADVGVQRREIMDHFSAGRASIDKTIRWLRLSHGCLVIALPLAVHPRESAEFFRRVELIVGHAPTRFPWEFAMAGPILAMTTAVVIAITAVRLWPHRSRWQRWTIESTVIAFAAVSLHPEFFIGLYLLAWHAPKHLLDLRTRHGAQENGSHRNGAKGIIRNIFGSLPFLLPAWFAVVALVWSGGGGMQGFADVGSRSLWMDWVAKVSAATVAVYIVVTLPHHLMQCGWLKPGLKRGIQNLGHALAGETVPAGSARATASLTSDQ